VPTEPCLVPSGRSRPRLEVADIFRAAGPAFLARFTPSYEQRKVMTAIEQCRTAVLGGHLDVCAACGHQQPAYNSCRNRHCPKCQGLAQARWLAKRRERILPTKYFHVVFTLPEQLRPLVRRNQKLLYDLLLECAARTLMEFGESRLHAQLGITTVLHTWTRDLRFHPHAHCIVTGGGLHLDGRRWIPTSKRFLFPVDLMSSVFRGKFAEGLSRLYDRQQLDLGGSCARFADPSCFRQLTHSLFQKPWVVYAKPPFGGAEQVFAYLGRYTHRVGMSNRRLLHFDGARVVIKTKGRKTAVIDAVEFIRRLLLHVLPSGFVKIRHYGLVAAANIASKLVIAHRCLLEQQPEPPAELPVKSVPSTPTAPQTWRELLLVLTGIDLSMCQACGALAVQRQPLPSRASSPPDTS